MSEPSDARREMEEGGWTIGGGASGSSPARGSAAGVESEVCATCRGRKLIIPMGYQGEPTDCPTCDGTGRVEKAKPQPNDPS